MVILEQISYQRFGHYCIPWSKEVRFLHKQTTDQSAELRQSLQILWGVLLVLLFDPLPAYAETAPPYSNYNNDQNLGTIFTQVRPLFALFLSVNFFGFNSLNSETKTNINSVKTELKVDTDRLESKMESKFTVIESKLTGLESNITGLPYIPLLDLLLLLSLLVLLYAAWRQNNDKIDGTGKYYSRIAIYTIAGSAAAVAP
jgi:hypothetical protein